MLKKLINEANAPLKISSIDCSGNVVRLINLNVLDEYTMRVAAYLNRLIELRCTAAAHVLRQSSQSSIRRTILSKSVLLHTLTCMLIRVRGALEVKTENGGTAG
eukprot:3312358-Pleurochrysis_carterae.AAC.1